MNRIAIRMFVVVWLALGSACALSQPPAALTQPSLTLGPITTLPAPATRPAVAHDFRRNIQVVRADKPPVIDGQLDDAVWAKAVVLKDFYVTQMFDEKALPARAADQTEARVLFDDAGLYVAVKAFQDPKSIYTKIKANGWLRPDLDWQSGSEEWCNSGCDEIEVAVDPELTMCSHYIFHVNPDGVMQKHYMVPALASAGLYKRIDPVLTQDDRWKAAARKTADGWTAEFFIPYESIGFQKIKPAQPNDVYFDMVQEQLTVMGFNIHRISHQRREASTFSPSKGPHFFRDAEHFAVASFRPRPCWLGDVKIDDLDRNTVSYRVRSRADKAQDVTIETHRPGRPTTAPSRQALKVEPEGTVTGKATFFAESIDQPIVDVRLRDAKNDVIDRVRLQLDGKPRTELAMPKAELFDDESDVWAELTVDPAIRADHLLYLSIQVPGSFGQRKLPDGSRFLLPFQARSLPENDLYGLGVGVYAGEKRLALAHSTFRVSASPYGQVFKGTAGKGEGAAAAKTPEWFTLQADGPEKPSEAKLPAAPVPGFLTEEMKKAPLLVWPVTAAEDFDRQLSVRPAQLGEPIRAFAAGEQYEPICFAVQALRDIKALRVEASELKAAAGGIIPAGQMDLRVEDLATLLVKQETIAGLPSGALRKYWLTVYAAPGTPAGLYKGKLTLTADAAAPIEREYALLVLPYALEPSPLHMGIYGGWSAGAGATQTTIEIRDALAHGMEGLHCGAIVSSSWRGGADIHHLIWDMPIVSEEGWLGPSPERFNTAKINEDVLKVIQAAGIKPPIVVDVNYPLRYLPCTRENAELFGELVAKIEAKRKELGLGEFVYHLVDEPHNHYGYDDGRYGRRYGIEKVAFFGQVVKDLGPRVYETMNSGRQVDVGEKARDQIDIWCSNDIFEPQQVERWTAPGKELWLYNFAGDGICKGRHRSTYGFYANRVKANGVTFWVYQEMHAWNAKEKKTVAMARWEAIRSGIDDTRYVATLRKAIAAATAAGGEKAKQAQAAQATLDGILNQFPVVISDKVEFEKTMDAEMSNRWRWQLADWIVKLQQP